MTQRLLAGGYGLLPVTEVPLDLLSGFSCGKPHLDEFLTERAEFFHREHLGFCWVVLHRDWTGPVGYFTLHNEAVELIDHEESDLGLSDYSGLKRFPAICIGRLAVDERLQGTGASDQLMTLVFGLMAGESLQPSAARILVVDADNDPKVLRYYERNGFARSQWADKQAAHQGSKRQPRATIKMLRDILLPW